MVFLKLNTERHCYSSNSVFGGELKALMEDQYARLEYHINQAVCYTKEFLYCLNTKNRGIGKSSSEVGVSILGENIEIVWQTADKLLSELTTDIETRVKQFEITLRENLLKSISATLLLDIGTKSNEKNNRWVASIDSYCRKAKHKRDNIFKEEIKSLYAESINNSFSSSSSEQASNTKVDSTPITSTMNTGTGASSLTNSKITESTGSSIMVSFKSRPNTMRFDAQSENNNQKHGGSPERRVQLQAIEQPSDNSLSVKKQPMGNPNQNKVEDETMNSSKGSDEQNDSNEQSTTEKYECILEKLVGDHPVGMN